MWKFNANRVWAKLAHSDGDCNDFTVCVYVAQKNFAITSKWKTYRIIFIKYTHSRFQQCNCIENQT